MADPAFLMKAASIERCTAHAREELASSLDFATDYTRQDAATLNVLRACEAAIDIGAMLINRFRLAPPIRTRDIFAELGRRGLISKELSDKLEQMVGFRNLAVHDYPEIDLALTRQAIGPGLDDLRELADAAIKAIS